MEKFIILVNIFYLLFFKDIYIEEYLSLEDANDELSNFAAKSKNLDKGKKTIKKEFFKNNLGLFVSASEEVQRKSLNKFHYLNQDRN